MESRLWDVPKGDYLKMSGSKWKINIPLNCLFVFLILPKRKLSKNTSYCREQLASTISWYHNNGAQKYKVKLFINNSLNQSCLWYILLSQSGKSYLTVMEATGKTTARNLKMFLMMVCQYQLMNTFLVIWGKSVFRSTGVYQVLNVSRNLNLNFAEILCSPQYWILWHFTLTTAQNVMLTKVQYPLTCMFQINISNFISQGQNPKMEAFQNFVFPY